MGNEYKAIFGTTGERTGETMPTYEYECEKKGHRFEVFQNMSDAPVKKCPECGGKAKRMIGMGGAVIVRGSGHGKAPEGPCRGCDMACDMRQ